MIDRSTYETYVVDTDGMTLDLIVWRRYRRQTPGLVEATLDMNYGLAAQAGAIARGTIIRMPLDRKPAPSEIAVTKLW